VKHKDRFEEDFGAREEDSFVSRHTFASLIGLRGRVDEMITNSLH
jgi:hypothetical protein